MILLNLTNMVQYSSTMNYYIVNVHVVMDNTNFASKHSTEIPLPRKAPPLNQ